MRATILSVILATGAACSAATSLPGPIGTPSLAPTPVATDKATVSARPYDLHVPTSYDKTKPTALVILLHGYGGTGAAYDAYFGLRALSDQKTFFYAAPNGTLDSSGKRFWNATNYCCAFGADVDDVAYVNAIIDDVGARYALDRKRVFLVGHSNGGFMAHRFACDMAGRVAAIASLAGAQWSDQSKCSPSEKVSVVQIHGEADGTIKYAGDTRYPSAHETVADWAVKNGCTGALSTTGATLDLDTGVAGAETSVERYSGCTGSAVELWTIRAGAHTPALARPAFPEAVWAFLSAHPKP